MYISFINMYIFSYFLNYYVLNKTNKGLVVK